MSGNALPPELLDFEQAGINETANLAAEYESTVKLVDARNDRELELLQTQEHLNLAAEQLDQTNPNQSTKIRAVFGDPS